jgi:general secretion pathway protein L
MLTEFAIWWMDQMRGLIPGGASGGARQPDAIIVAVDRLADGQPAGAGRILRRQDGVETVLGPLDLDRPAALASHQAAAQLATGLRLRQGTVLERDVVLPLAAAQDLQAVLGFEMDRLTPFAPDEVYWGVTRLQRDHVRGKLSLRLYIVLRAQVDVVVQRLAAIGLLPSYIEIPGGRIELGRAAAPTRRYLQMALPVLCAVLAVACVAVPFVRQQMALAATANVIAANAPAADVALSLRRQLATAASARAAIAQARRAGDALGVLATLTAALPDGTWLSDLTLKSGDLTFDGQSADAAKLIGLLSAVPGLRNPNFTSPVTRTADGKADLFSIDAQVTP